MDSFKLSTDPAIQRELNSMVSRKKKSLAATSETPPVPITQSNEQREKAAQCEMELVRLFLLHGKHEIARRRLQQILTQFSQTPTAMEASQVLQGL